MARNWNDERRFRGRTGAEPWRGPLGGHEAGRMDPGLMRDYGSTQVGAGEGYWTSADQAEEDRYDHSDYGGGRDYARGDGDRPSRRYRDEERRYRPRQIHTQDYGGRVDDGEGYDRYVESRRYAPPRPGRYDGEFGDDYGYAGRQHGFVPYDRGLRGRDARPQPDERRYNVGDQRRDFWDRAGDEVASWFGDNDAQARRDMDRMHRGRGPKNYKRSSERIREDVCDCLSDDWVVDASDVEVHVSGNEVTLMGTVPTREQRRRAEDLAERISGVTHVQNNIRVASLASPDSSQGEGAVNKASSASTGGSSGPEGGSTIKAA